MRLRHEKIARIASDIPELEVLGSNADADTLIIGWGGTYGHIRSAVDEPQRRRQARGNGTLPLHQPPTGQHRRRSWHATSA